VALRSASRCRTFWDGVVLQSGSIGEVWAGPADAGRHHLHTDAGRRWRWHVKDLHAAVFDSYCPHSRSSRAPSGRPRAEGSGPS